MNPVEIKAILAQIKATGKRFTGKDSGLIRTMKEYVKEGRYASSRQAAWLKDLYDQAVGGGRYQRNERI